MSVTMIRIARIECEKMTDPTLPVFCSSYSRFSALCDPKYAVCDIAIAGR